MANTNLIAIYREIINAIGQTVKDEEELIRRYQASVKVRKASMKTYEDKIKELKNRNLPAVHKSMGGAK
mgnify:CR=1 FL=1